MGGRAAALRDFLAAEPAAVLVAVSEARGSTPRDADAWMLVAPNRIFGTIGGGQLEFMAIDEARRILADAPLELLIVKAAPAPHPAFGHLLPVNGEKESREGRGKPPSPRSRGEGPAGDEGQRKPVRLNIPLGPEIGQCCGGRVELELTMADDRLRTNLLARIAIEERALPLIYLFGGGHVGHALAAALALLPVRTTVVETREDALAGLPAGVETRLTPVPEALVREAPAGSAFVILTHDHALDFLIAAEALRRPDAAYVGMIGSATKKATFRSWARANAPDANTDHLITPIGGAAVRDKRPTVIAALAAAEIMTALARG